VTACRSVGVADETEGGPVIDAQERFVGLYDSCYRRVLGYAGQHVDPSVAEDVASETFLIAWRRLGDVPDPPLAWLLAVARNLLRQQYGALARQRRLETRITALTSAEDLLAWDAAEHVIERAAAVEALAALPPDDIETLTLTTWHGLSPAEAAAVVGCSPRAFTVRLSRARRRLASALSLTAGRAPAAARSAAPARAPAPARSAAPSPIPHTHRPHLAARTTEQS
jgi:RNA polymerase sigma factor (sigma-70 family)